MITFEPFSGVQTLRVSSFGNARSGAGRIKWLDCSFMGSVPLSGGARQASLVLWHAQKRSLSTVLSVRVHQLIVARIQIRPRLSAVMESQ